MVTDGDAGTGEPTQTIPGSSRATPGHGLHDAAAVGVADAMPPVCEPTMFRQLRCDWSTCRPTDTSFLDYQCYYPVTPKDLASAIVLCCYPSVTPPGCK